MRSASINYGILAQHAQLSRIESWHEEGAALPWLIGDLRARDSSYAGPTAGAGYSSTNSADLKSRTFDVPAIAGLGRRYEELDQLVIELLLGAR